MKYTVLSLEQECYPKALQQISNPPQNLYALGNLSLLSSNSILAIVGSRDCTEYGRNQAFHFAKELSQSHYTIISGLAIGIDSSAHIGALQGEGNTIAVLGSGFSHIYPEENIWLFHQILQKGGCILSEYPPDTEVSMKNFPKRNRIISGIAHGVLVVEAGFRSGSTITARLARDLQKNIFCLPSNITSKNSMGAHILIRQGAELVFSPSQILEKMGSIPTTSTPTPFIPENYQAVYHLLLSGPLSINQIAKSLSLNLPQLQSLLTMMELDGFVEQLPGNEFKRK